MLDRYNYLWQVIIARLISTLDPRLYVYQVTMKRWTFLPLMLLRLTANSGREAAVENGYLLFLLSCTGILQMNKLIDTHI